MTTFFIQYIFPYLDQILFLNILCALGIFFPWYVFRYSSFLKIVFKNEENVFEQACPFCLAFWTTFFINGIVLLFSGSITEDNMPFSIFQTTIFLTPPIFAFLDASYQKLLGGLVEIH